MVSKNEQNLHSLIRAEREELTRIKRDLNSFRDLAYQLRDVHYLILSAYNDYADLTTEQNWNRSQAILGTYCTLWKTDEIESLLEDFVNLVNSFNEIVK